MTRRDIIRARSNARVGADVSPEIVAQQKMAAGGMIIALFAMSALGLYLVA